MKNKLRTCVFFMFGLLLQAPNISAQLTPVAGGWIFYVSNYNDAGTNTLREGIDWANNAASHGISGSMTIAIVANTNISFASNYVNSPGCIPGYQTRQSSIGFVNSIILESDLPTITLLNTPITDLTIWNVPGSYCDGIVQDPIINNIVTTLPNPPPSPVTRALEINTGNSSTANPVKVKLSGLTFLNWNVSLSSFGSAFGFSFGDCVIADDIKELEIEGCYFTNYEKGIRYNQVETMKIHDNHFSNLIQIPMEWDPINNNGYTYPYVYLTNPTVQYSKNSMAIVNNNTTPLPSNSPNYVSYINTNDVTAQGRGTGILLNPMYLGALPQYAYVNSFSNYDVKTHYYINSNSLLNLETGIFQGLAPPKRTGVDNTYSLSILYNTIKVTHVGIWLGSPYRSFIVNHNDLYVLCTSGSYGINHPEALHFGYHLNNLEIQTSPNNLIFQYNFLQDNQFGFDIKPGKNDNNSFFPDPSTPTIKPLIIADGNFGPATVGNGTNTGIYIEGLTFPGAIVVDLGMNTNITKCLLETTIPAGAAPQYSINPITLSYPPHTNYATTTPYVAPNGGISKPFLQEAFITPSGAIKIALNLNGNMHIDSNGPFRLEFFKVSQSVNDPNDMQLVGYVYQQTIQNLYPGSTSFIISIAPAVAQAASVGYGSWLGVTVTSLGTNLGKHCGTSEVAYIKIVDCPNCIGEFSPMPGKSYVLSAWVKVSGAGDAITYINTGSQSFRTPIMEVKFYSALNSNTVQLGSTLNYKPSGPIIDGWQKIEGVFDVPAAAKGISIVGTHDQVFAQSPNNFCTTYFDDIRVFPVDGAMKSYAYDEDSKKLMAELDDNNFATFYEYDEEGKLTRVKKETERGIMTIKESKNSKPIR